jgi:hypothetical protein
MEFAEKPEEVEYLIGVDDNDPDADEYKRLFSTLSKYGRVVVNVSDSRCNVEALNRLGPLMSPTTELIVGIEDDHGTCPYWDTELFKMLEGVDNFKDIRFIGVSDGMRAYGNDLLYFTVNRAWYARFGWFVYPEYTGWFADNDFHRVAERLNCIVHAPHLVFQHRHHTLGLTPFDSTYARTDNPKSRGLNLDIYDARAARNFDI